MMKKDRRLIGLACLLIGSAAYGLGVDNRGASGADFLRIGPGARPAAMGEAFSAVADDVHALYYNPAGLGAVSSWRMTGMHNEYFQGVGYDFFAVAAPLQTLWGSPSRTLPGVVGLGVQSLSVSDLQRRGSSDSDQPTGAFGANDLAFTLAYAQHVGDALSLGASLKVIQQTLDDRHDGFFAADLGGQYQAGERWTFGAGMRHLGPSPHLGGPADPLPSLAYVGAAYRPQNGLLLCADAASTRAGRDILSSGLEYSHELAPDIHGALRLGYTTRNSDAGGMAGAAAGGGIGFRTMDVDFAWVPFGDLGDTYRFSLSLKF